MKMKPLCITASMMEPVVYYGDGMHLDGILAYAAFMDLDAEAKNKIPPINSAWAEDFDLPLSKWFVKSITGDHIDDRLFVENPDRNKGNKEGMIWGWRASAVHAKWFCRDRYAIRRKPELDAMARYTQSPSVNIGAGQQKATNILLPARFATEFRWYAVGDSSRVERLLKMHVRAIGKITTKGPGRVANWKVESCENDWSIEREGILVRTMPIGYVTHGGYVAEASIRPPYHHQSRVVTALRPDWLLMENIHDGE